MVPRKIPMKMVRHLDMTFRITSIEHTDRENKDEFKDGDVFIRVRLGWKAVAGIGLVVIQSLFTLLSQQFNLF